MNIKQLRELVRETIRDLHESSFSVNAEIDRAFNSIGVYPPKMVNVGGDRYEGEIDKGWKLGYDETAGTIDVNGKSFRTLVDAAKFYKQNKEKPITMNPTLESLQDHELYLDDPPSHGEDLTLDRIPEPVKSIFEALIEEDRRLQVEQAEDDEESDEDGIVTEVTMGRIDGGFYLGLHDEFAPFNPSGVDYYFASTGQYLGWCES